MFVASALEWSEMTLVIEWFCFLGSIGSRGKAECLCSDVTLLRQYQVNLFSEVSTIWFTMQMPVLGSKCCTLWVQITHPWTLTFQCHSETFCPCLVQLWELVILTPFHYFPSLLVTQHIWLHACFGNDPLLTRRTKFRCVLGCTLFWCCSYQPTWVRPTHCHACEPAE